MIVSHVDTKEGPALFFNLLKLQRGSPIAVRDRRGDRAPLRGRPQAPGGQEALRAVGGLRRRAQRPTLVLITCGGPFSEDTGYRDNVILWARAV